MKHSIPLTLIGFFLVYLSPALAQTNEGTEFWFAFMEHRDIGLNSKVAMITAKQNTSGRISIPGQGWSEFFTVQANEVTLINLPTAAETLGSEKITQTGVQVTTNDPVSVYIHQYYNRRAEAAVVLPRETLGRAYYVMSYYGIFRDAEEYPSQFIVVAREDDTQISIRLADDSKGGRSKGTTFSISLDAGESYQVQTRLGSGDLTGSLVTANKNFAIFGGARWTVVPANCGGAWDNLLEQMYPIDSWGKQFVTVPNASVNFDVFRILASENNTRVEVHGVGTDVYELDAGEFIEYQSSVSTYIVGNKPILAAQYNVGSFCSGHNVGDPSMVLLNSIEQTRDTVTLYNSTFQNIVENYINVIARTVDIDFVLFDGQTFAEQNVDVFPVQGNNDFSFARVRVSRGSHTIIAEGCGVIATAYGYGDVESYAYSGGASFSKINANPIPEGGCLNDTIFFNTGLSPLRYSVSWDLGDGTRTTESKFGHIYNQLGDYEVQLIISDDCLMTIDTFYRDLKVTLRKAVEAEPDVQVCEGEAVQLGATDLAGARYEWKGPAGFFSGEQFPLIRNADPGQSGRYEVVGIISGCATFPEFLDVHINPTPQPELGPDTIICIKNSDLEYVLEPGNFSRFEWSTGQLSASIVVREEGMINVKVYDELGCAGTDEVMITEQCPTKIYIPNAFSPNYDGTNDTFTVLGTDIAGLHLQIFDRWGTLMFESTDFTPWDGRYRGKWVGPGVYVWVAVIDGFDENAQPFTERRSGSVTLMK